MFSTAGNRHSSKEHRIQVCKRYLRSLWNALWLIWSAGYESMRKPLRTRSIASPLDEESGDFHVYRLGASQAVVHRAMSVGPSKQLSQVVTLIVIQTLFVSFCVNCLLKPSCEIPSWVKLGSETLSPSTRDKLRSTCGFRQWKTNQTALQTTEFCQNLQYQYDATVTVYPFYIHTDAACRLKPNIILKSKHLSSKQQEPAEF